jgi:hypothetical protein
MHVVLLRVFSHDRTSHTSVHPISEWSAPTQDRFGSFASLRRAARLRRCPLCLQWRPNLRMKIRCATR